MTTLGFSLTKGFEMTSEVALPESMLAAVLRTQDEPVFNLEQIPVPRPRTGEVLLKVEACGVCHSDLHVARGQIAFPRPAVLGHEMSGTVVALGPGVEKFQEGDRVVGGFIMPCTKCENCLRGRDDICDVFFVNNRLNGALLDGESRLVDASGAKINMYSAAGFAEYAVIPASALAFVDGQLDLASAAVLGCAGMTAFSAVTRGAGDVKDAVVCIIAVGGVGLSITQVVAALGARQIIAVDVNDEKLELAAKLGATHTVNALRSDVIETVKALSGGGVDFAFEALGSPLTLGQAVRVLGEGGRAVAVGLASGDAEVTVPITNFVRRGQELIGSYGARTRVDLPAVQELAKSGGFSIENLVTDTYPLEQINQAYADLASGSIRGRAVIKIS